MGNTAKTLAEISAIICFVILIMASSCEDGLAASETMRRDYVLSGGVTESALYVTDSNKNNVRVHILRIEKGYGISMKVATKKYYSKATKAERKEYSEDFGEDKWGFSTVKEQAESYEAASDTEGEVIAAINGDFFDKETNGKTAGRLIAEGNVLNASEDAPFFAVNEEGNYGIKYKNSSSDGIEEAVGGRTWLVKNGDVIDEQLENERYMELQCIGITDDRDIVVLTVDGREPSSEGLTLMDAGRVLKKQGCDDAILLDCGGSATLYTRREGNSELKLRSVPGDGVVRDVSSSLLFVKGAEGETDAEGETTPEEESKETEASEGSQEAAAYEPKIISMVESGTGLIKKSSGLYFYKIDGKKQKGLIRVNGKLYLFDKKGKGATKKLKIGKTKYVFKKGLLKKCSDKKAGKITSGYCGAAKDGRNMVYVYHYGSGLMNIGLAPYRSKKNGKMATWAAKILAPWHSERYRIRKVVIGKGVKNLGRNAFSVSLDPFNTKLTNAKTRLKAVSFSSSLKDIGNDTFANVKTIRKVVIPKSVKRIGISAFKNTRHVKFIFKGKKHPAMGKKALNSKGKKTLLKARRTKSWKKYLKKKANRKKIGFSGKIKYYK